MTTTFCLLAALVACQVDTRDKPDLGNPADQFAGLAGEVAKPETPPTEAREEASDTLMRRWRSKDGKSSITGEYVGFEDGRVVIKKQPDAKIVRIKPTDLEEADMKWVREQVKLMKAARPSKYDCPRCRDKQIADCPVKNCKGGKLYNKVDVPSVVPTPYGDLVVVHARLLPTGTCDACGGRGQIPCPQCMQKNSLSAREEAEYERALRDKSNAERRDRAAEIAKLHDTNTKLKLEMERLRLEREKSAVQGAEDSGMGKEEADLREANRKLEEEVRAAELERKRREYEKDKSKK